MWLNCDTIREWHWSKGAGMAVVSFTVVNRIDAVSAFLFFFPFNNLFSLLSINTISSV